MMQSRKTAQRAFRGLVGLPPASKPAQNPTLSTAVQEATVDPPEEKERMVAEIVETKAQRLARWRKRLNVDAAQRNAIEAEHQKWLQVFRDKLLMLPVDKLPGTNQPGVISEDDLREQFGLEKPESKPKLPTSYRQLLNLDPQDIIGFFNLKVGEHTDFVRVDFVVPPSMLEHRIRRLQKLIACSKQIIEGMASRILKIRRGENDPLLTDKAAREKYKRDENARIARSNVKLSRYRAAVRSNKDCHDKIWQWVTTPAYFCDVVDDCMTFRTTTDVRWEDTKKLFTGGLQTHTRVELIEYFRSGTVDLEAYRAVMSLGEAALVELGETESEAKETWQNIARWENNVIRAAVHYQIITPRRDLAELLGLGEILDENDDPIEADTTEDALAIKTSGRCFGGRIKSEGFRYRGGKVTPRSLSDFDKPFRNLAGDGPGGYEDAGFGSLHDVSDDTESYDPR